MPDRIDDLIPNATQIRKEAALMEAEKADEFARAAAAAEAEKRALIERLTHPSRWGPNFPRRRPAGVFGKSAHGVRKGAAIRAAENGATERELEAIFGCSGGRMATLNTKSANRSRLAAGAIGKLDRGETENRTSIPAPMAEVWAGNRKSE
jgi:hypothetical protein